MYSSEWNMIQEEQEQQQQQNMTEELTEDTLTVLKPKSDKVRQTDCRVEI